MDFNSKKLSNIRVKSMAVSIPCVTGPYVSSNVKIRMGNDEVVTSTAVNDSGVFEANFSQPKYLPFEYLSIDGDDDQTSVECELMLDKDSTYDVTTIADVVLHVSYLAKNDDNIESSPPEVNEPVNEKYLLMSWRYDFPAEWQLYIEGSNATPVVTPPAPTLSSKEVPYRFRGAFKELTNHSPVEYKTLLSSGIETSSSLPVYDANNMDAKIEDIWLLYKISND